MQNDLRQAGTDTREALRVELARRLAIWETSDLLGKEFADEVIEVVLAFYPNVCQGEKRKIDAKGNSSAGE